MTRFAKTGGNPFFMLQFLNRLAESGLLRYDDGAGRSIWDGRAIGARQFSDNVIDLMVARLQQPACNTLELVKLLACLVPHASVESIARVAGMSGSELDECLWPAARLGLVTRDAHAYRFMHDRVREAAYWLIARPSLPERHLHMGRALPAAADPHAQGDLVFAVAGHLNRACEAMREPDELRALAALNAQAGARAHRAAAYELARRYFELAEQLTPEGAWHSDREATFALHRELAVLDEHARTRLERAQVALYQVVGRFKTAVEVALAALALFGVTFAHATRSGSCRWARWTTPSLFWHWRRRSPQTAVLPPAAADA